MSFNVDIFYDKLLENTTKSGKMRWNAICEDIISIYFSSFLDNKRILNHDTFWDLLFNSSDNTNEKKKRLQIIFTDIDHFTFFRDIVFIAIDDPKSWNKWVSHFKY
jgi:hypothetical protein